MRLDKVLLLVMIWVRSISTMSERLVNVAGMGGSCQRDTVHVTLLPCLWRPICDVPCVGDLFLCVTHIILFMVMCCFVILAIIYNI